MILVIGWLVMSAFAQKPALPSKVYKFEDMAVRDNGQNKSRAILEGWTAQGYGLETHMTELAPGLMPHAAHSHAHAEMVMILDGTLEIEINGKVEKAGPGSVAYVAPNEHHGWKNVGTTRARYFIVTMGREPRQPAR
jgi:quercetin dioxygenase-like cupin family protein